jgi:hypothetical protein
MATTALSPRAASTADGVYVALLAPTFLLLLGAALTRTVLLVLGVTAAVLDLPVAGSPWPFTAVTAAMWAVCTAAGVALNRSVRRLTSDGGA